jgi:hypothetical protein
MKYCIKIGEDGGWLCLLQNFELEERINEWVQGGYMVIFVAESIGDELAKQFTLHNHYAGAYTESGGNLSPYIPFDQIKELIG